MKKNEQGRSMIEMLGVLAIVGILSVGGIAGFSKAMMKYKLNKQTEQIVSILNYASINMDMLFQSFNGRVENVTEILKNTGAFPEEMLKSNTPNYVYDIFGNTVWVQMLKYDSGEKYFELMMTLKERATESCVNLALLAKQYSENLWRVKYGEEQNSLWGDSYCGEDTDCLRDVTIAEILESCKICEKRNCPFWFQQKF
ncbi:MAG: hypothetical protein NC218_05140 [Acetobacter sp.]|nr:hypothetical protein [Acetobacter sp.]